MEKIINYDDFKHFIEKIIWKTNSPKLKGHLILSNPYSRFNPIVTSEYREEIRWRIILFEISFNINNVNIDDIRKLNILFYYLSQYKLDYEQVENTNKSFLIKLKNDLEDIVKQYDICVNRGELLSKPFWD